MATGKERSAAKKKVVVAPSGTKRLLMAIVRHQVRNAIESSRKVNWQRK
jgi:hypothetical protein